MVDDALLLSHAQEYCQLNGLRLTSKERLGHGSDGSVWVSSSDTAVKALYLEENYQKEVECYRRLKTAGIRNLGGYAVPMLKGWDDRLQVIEMTIVQPPYLLDFGKVYLDHPPTY